MKIKHVIEELQTLDPEAHISIQLNGYVSRATEVGDGEIVYSRPVYEPLLCGVINLHPDDFVTEPGAVTIRLSHEVRYELADRLVLSGELMTRSLHRRDDPEYIEDHLAPGEIRLRPGADGKLHDVTAELFAEQARRRATAKAQPST